MFACVYHVFACACTCKCVDHTVIPFLLISEVVADDTPAVDAVLKADTKRLELLEEVRPCFQGVQKRLLLTSEMTF